MDEESCVNIYDESRYIRVSYELNIYHVSGNVNKETRLKRHILPVCKNTFVGIGEEQSGQWKLIAVGVTLRRGRNETTPVFVISSLREEVYEKGKEYIINNTHVALAGYEVVVKLRFLKKLLCQGQ